MKIGEMIYKARIDQDLTQSKLGDLVTPSMKKQQVHAIEAGTTTPTTKTVGRICEALGITVVELYSYGEE